MLLAIAVEQHSTYLAFCHQVAFLCPLTESLTHSLSDITGDKPRLKSWNIPFDANFISHAYSILRCSFVCHVLLLYNSCLATYSTINECLSVHIGQIVNFPHTIGIKCCDMCAMEYINYTISTSMSSSI